MKQSKLWCEERSYRFAKLPMTLITDPQYKNLSLTAKLLYTLLLDRLQLSLCNGWEDSEGEPYIYYSVREACKPLSCGHDKVTHAMRDLERAALLRRQRQGLGKPDRLYVLPFSTACDIPAVLDADHTHSGVLNLSIPESEKGAPNQTDSSNTEVNHTHSIHYPTDEEELKELIFERIDFDHFSRTGNGDTVSELVQIMVDAILGQSQTIRIAGTDYAADYVRKRLLSLTEENISQVLSSMQRNPTNIKRPKAYFLAALFDSAATTGLYYETAANYDLSARKQT